MVDDFYNHERGGVFVDIGAFDGVTHSNTWFLEKHRGWTGLCVEPNPEQFAILKKERSCKCFNCGAGTETAVMPFVKVSGYAAAMSAFGRCMNSERLEQYTKDSPHTIQEIGARVRRTQDLLDVVGISRVHYLSIDVDGFEQDVILGIDFRKTNIGIITVENIDCDTGIRNLLAARGFSFLGRLGWDDLWINNSIARFLSVPVPRNQRGFLSV